MKTKYKTHHILEVVLLVICLAVFPAENLCANEDSKYLDAVREFADNVLEHGRDTWGEIETPLFADGLNIHTLKPVEWIAPNGERWILCNLASQQNFFRMLVGLTAITGDPKYKQAAMEAIEYAFANLRSPNGLLYWGNTTAYDIRRDEVFGWRIGAHYVHVLKAHFPYYELMWHVNPDVTRTFIESFWSAHVIDWSNLAMDRIGQFYDELEQAWRHQYRGGPTFLESGSGKSFFNAGSDLVYAAAALAKLSGDKESLIWAKRLTRRYVKTRHPETGISYPMYTKPEWKVRESYDDVMRRLVPGTVDFLPIDFPWCQYTNPILRESALGQFTPTPGVSVHKHVFYWQSQFLVGEMLGGEGGEFKKWTLEELTAFGKASYRKKDNVYVPILTDGTNLEGYVVKEDGPLGPKGVTLEPLPAGPSDFWAYALGYRVTGDDYMWEMAHSIAKGNEFGDMGATPKSRPQLKTDTDCLDPYALLAFLELHRETGKNAFLDMAKKIGDNILANRFHKGFFVASNKHIYTKFDAIDPLVLLHLYSALAGEIRVVPQVWPSLPHFICPYSIKGTTIDNTIIYTLTESTEPLISLNEAAAMGNTELVKSLIAKGADVNATNNLGNTPLYYAARNGHKDIVELLITKGADVNAKNENGQAPLDIAVTNNRKDIIDLLVEKGADLSLHVAVSIGDPAIVQRLIESGADVNAKKADGDMPLHSAVGAGHKDIVELLIAKGADVNTKNNNGETPLNLAVRWSRKEIVELLLAKGADITFHAAAYLGDLTSVQRFVSNGVDVNIKDAIEKAPLHYAVQRGHKDIAEFLLSNGADINAKNNQGQTPLGIAASRDRKDIIELLVEKGADISLHVAASIGDPAIVQRLIESGADVNAKDKFGCTPLYYAIWKQDKDTVKLLVTKGADVSFTPERNYPALHYAVWFEDADMVKLLVANGAKFDVKDQGGWTAFRYAASQGNRELVEFFVSKVADVSSFHMAACVGDLARVKNFVEQGTDVDTKDEFGWSSLHWAVCTGQKEVAEFLITKGANVNVETNDNSRPLHQAAQVGGRKLAELLISKGADVNAKAKNGNTPLHSAASAGHREVIELLIAKGANVDEKGINGQTPLYRAAQQGHGDVVEVLVAKGANIDAKARSDQTALHLAAVMGRKDMAALLIVQGADLDSQDVNGQTPLHLSARQGRRDTAELLITKGADVNAKNKRGRTPLDLAVSRGHTEIVELLRKHGAKE